MTLLAFDLETAALLPEGERPDPKSGLGITCLGISATRDGEEIHTSTRQTIGSAAQDTPGYFAPRASKSDVQLWLSDMALWQLSGHTTVTWNGLFDWHVLGIEAGDVELAALLCKRHVDLMFAFHGIKGFPLGLKAAAEAIGSHKGTDDVADGALAPQLWAEGKQQQVLNYVRQDALATLEIALHLQKHRGFSWTTRRGGVGRFTLPSTINGLGDMTVEKVMQWPEPDQKWMDNPLTRAELVHWITEAL